MRGWGIPCPLSACLLTIAMACAPGGAESDTGKFTFRPDRVPVGTALHYVQSDADGPRRVLVTVYVADTSRLEIVMREPGQEAGRRILAHFDWATFSADTLASWYPFPDGPSQPLVAIRITADGRFVAELDGQADTIDIPRFPAHIHDAGFATLAPLFAHLRDPEGAFTIGVFHPVPDGAHLLSFAGPATIRFEGEVPCHAAVCRRYDMSGPGLRGARGAISAHRERGYVQSIELRVPDDSLSQSFTLELERVEPMDRATWDRWTAAEAVKP